MKRVMNGGYLSEWWVKGREGNEIQISHLLFADDNVVAYVRHPTYGMGFRSPSHVL